MRLWQAALGMLLLASAATPAKAAVTGQELLERCTAAEKSLEGKGALTGEEALDSMWCMGYMSGLLDGFSVGDFKVGGTRVMCMPEEGVSRTQAMYVVNKWLRAHPDALPKSGRRGALLGLASAYPCK